MANVEPVRDGPWAGWLGWVDPMPGTFLAECIGRSYSKPDGANRAIVMLEPQPHHLNRMGILHGGFLAAFADHVLFAGLTAMGRPEQAYSVTIDLTMQFLGTGKADLPLRAEIELLRETGRLLFLRMTIGQDGDLIAASTATVRKAPAAK